MFYQFFIILLLAFEIVANRIQRCGVVKVPDEIYQAAAFMSQNGTDFATAGQPMIRIHTFAHVVTTKKLRGHYSLAHVHDQIHYMNKHYLPHGISFKLIDTTFTTNDKWANNNPDRNYRVDLQMKKKLRRGSYNDLNLYFTSGLGSNSNFAGVCYYPVGNVRFRSQRFYLDGCNVWASTLPHGNDRYSNLGGTATHEVGHWFGLIHVFEGRSCSSPGDHIADTPRQKRPTYYCPRNKDTCKGKGLDNIHNFMDYSSDHCYTHFTRDQGLRMHDMYRRFRASH